MYWLLQRFFLIVFIAAITWYNYVLTYIVFKERVVPFAIYFLLALFCIFELYLIGFLRKCCSRVRVEGDSVTVRNYCGLGFKKTYQIVDFDGFINMNTDFKGKKNFYFCLLINGRVRVKVTNTTHKNYFLLRAQLAPRLKKLGRRDFNPVTEFAENLFL